MAMTDGAESTRQNGQNGQNGNDGHDGGGANGGRWLQLGLVSATLVAPLVARWRSLAEDDRIQTLQERAATLREQTAARLADARERARTLRQTLRRARRDGVAPASDAENVAQAIAPLMALVPDVPDTTAADQSRKRAVMTASFVVAGVTVGLVAAGALVYIILRNRALAHEERLEYSALHVDEFVVETAAAHPDMAPNHSAPNHSAPNHSAPNHERHDLASDPSREPGLAPEPVFSDEDAEGAEWIGDIYTHEYLPAAAALGPKLPAPARRIYFASETEARDAGYHRDGFIATDERE